MSSNTSGRASRGQPKLNTTARAIRAGLLASTAALALAGSGLAFAGTCTETAPLEVTCTGVFTDSVNNSIPPADQVPDLTLILDDGPTTVTPAVGVVGLDASWGGDVTVLSYADFSTDGADAIYQYGSDTATLNSYGDISTMVTAVGVNAIDISALNDVTLVVGGNVTATSDADYNVLAVTADSIAGNTSALVDATGNIVASAYNGDAIGVYAEAYGNTDFTNDGSVTATSAYGNAGGVIARAYNGDSTVTNTGYISADAYTTANGAVAGSKYGNASVSNSGDISATAYLANAIGVLGYADGDVYLGNTGTISADSASLYGAGIGMAGYAFTGDASLYNSGSISATGYTIAAGAAVTAYAGNASASNYGDISATASGDDAATATGLMVNGYTTASVYNDGSISASATAANETYGAATATGVMVTGTYGDVNLGADSVVSADASSIAEGSATGVSVIADEITFNNDGSIDASLSADGGYATGAYLQAQTALTVTNNGSINADGTGAFVQAVGLAALSDTGSVSVFNYGDITATADNGAVGVFLQGDVYSYLFNSGSIVADGGSYSNAIFAYGLGDNMIVNQGVITGSIYTYGGDDTLQNDTGGIWNAIDASYFGDGDDSIVNDGVINMDNASIDLGYHAVAGNSFYNNGTINLQGDNFINMGSGIALVPSLNPNAFYNYGVLDFQDGAPDDTLTITGDFAGDGDINVDVSGLDGVSDKLYIDGSVVSGTAGVINVDLLDLSSDIEALIPIVYVTGNSVDGNFVLGDVNWDADNSFVTLDFGIVSDIDATNATSDVFSLGIEATGLSDAGTLAAGIAPGVQSLINSQVGTWRQRMGVIDSFNKGGVSLWARVFQDKGDFSPEHAANNFGNGGNFDWEQKNRGAEAGIDFAVTDEFSLGLLAAKSKADLRLANPGSAEANIDADTWGVYGTWISPSGFYLDTSYRWTSFDLDMASIAGPMQGSGDAETFNVELGYAWTLAGGLKIEPQLQYTKTKVDNIDVFTTSNGMTFQNDGGESSRGRAGVALRKSFGDADNGWEFTPHVTLSAVREFDGQSNYNINNNAFVGSNNVEGTSGLVELGFNARHENLAVFAGVNWQDGGAMKNFVGGQLGVRYTFGGSSPAPAPAPMPMAPAKTCADLDDDGDGVNNCDDKCMGSTAGQAIGADGCPLPVAPEPEPMPEPKPFRG